MWKQLKVKMAAIVAMLMVLTASTGAVQEGFIASEGGFAAVGAVLGAVVLVLVASALMNTTSTNAKTAQTVLTTNGDSAAASIVGQWTLGVAIAVFIAIFSFAL